MKKYFSQNQIFTFLTILFLVTSCNSAIKKDLVKEKEQPKLIKTPGNGNLSCGLQDKSGNLWFGTSNNGLFKYDGKSFSQFLVTNGLNSNNIACLLEDKEGKIWIGTDVGLCLYDGKSFTQIQIPLPADLPPNKNQNYINSHWVYSIMQAKNGDLWLVTIDGVYVYDSQTYKLFIINEAENSFLGTNNKIERILEDKTGNIWFGGRTNEGVFRYDGKSITHFKLPEITLQFESKKVIHSWGWPQVQDKNGDIWFSNWAGAYRFDGNTFTSYSTSDGLAGYNGIVSKIIEDKSGNLYFGGDGGLSRYEPTLGNVVGQNKSFTVFNDGLINPWIWMILEDNAGNIWVGTRETGLYLFDGKSFINYSENEQ